MGGERESFPSPEQIQAARFDGLVRRMTSQIPDHRRELDLLVPQQVIPNTLDKRAILEDCHVVFLQNNEEYHISISHDDSQITMIHGHGGTIRGFVGDANSAALFEPLFVSQTLDRIESALQVQDVDPGQQ